MSKYKGKLGGKKGQKIRAGVSHPPFRAMPERKHLFSGGLPLITYLSRPGISFVKFGLAMQLMPHGQACPSGTDFDYKDCLRLSRKVPWTYGWVRAGRGINLGWLGNCFLREGRGVYYNRIDPRRPDRRWDKNREKHQAICRTPWQPPKRLLCTIVNTKKGSLFRISVVLVLMEETSTEKIKYLKCCKYFPYC